MVAGTGRVPSDEDPSYPYPTKTAPPVFEEEKRTFDTGEGGK